MIEHVSDTARWVAWHRARESERADALFKDPLAAKLAGPRTASTPTSKAFAFAMAVRTVAIDRLIGTALSMGTDTVINLGAGLDTRPYRMSLPKDLRWIEVDFPPLLDYKTQQLRSDPPVCRLERIPADLSRDADRAALFARLGSEARSAVVLTEGLVAYLANDVAAKLSRDLFAVPSFRLWIQDYRRGRLNRRAERRLEAPLQFDVLDPLAFFGAHGWVVREDLRILDEADRVGRALPFLFPWSLLRWVLPGTIREMGNRTYGYAMLGKA